MTKTDRIQYPARVERWGMYELELQGPEAGNPFTEQQVEATFTCAANQVRVSGFYDGDGRYRIRFMPSFTGPYSFRLESSFGAKASGTFEVTEADKDNHGPVHVANTWHFAYEDGTPYYSIGTTCYVWAWQNDEIIAQTLETLKKNAFNKIRFCVFPKHYDYNLKEPRSYPFEGKPMDSSVLNSENFYQYPGKTEGNS